MSSRVGLYALVASLVGTGAYALLSPTGSPPHETAEAAELKTTPTEIEHASLATALPPGHPPIAKGSSSNAPPVPTNDEDAAIVWKMPPGWVNAPSSSSMRIATYRVPHVAGDSEDGEMSVARAGGSTDANIQRWVGQFDNAGKDERTDSVVHGLHVSIVTVNGTFLGGGMTPGSAPEARHGWALLGAIVETTGSPYFFKLTGPVATIRAARPAFDALIASLATK